MLNEVLKIMSDDVKANLKQQEIKDLAVVSEKSFLYTLKLQIQCKKGI